MTPKTDAPSVKRLVRMLQILPVISVLVSIAIVAHQYSRRASLKAQIAQATKELEALEKREAELSGASAKPRHEHEEGDSH